MTTSPFFKPANRINDPLHQDRDNQDRVFAFVMFILLSILLAIMVWLATITNPNIDISSPTWFMP